MSDKKETGLDRETLLWNFLSRSTKRRVAGKDEKKKSVQKGKSGILPVGKKEAPIFFLSGDPISYEKGHLRAKRKGILTSKPFQTKKGCENLE